MYIKNRRNTAKFKAFGSYQTMCLTENLVTSKSPTFHILNVGMHSGGVLGQTESEGAPLDLSRLSQLRPFRVFKKEKSRATRPTEH